MSDRDPEGLIICSRRDSNLLRGRRFPPRSRQRWTLDRLAMVGVGSKEVVVEWLDEARV